MKHLSGYILIAAMATLTVSCKKDSESTPAPSKTELLTAKKWRLSASTSVVTFSGTSQTTDEYAKLKACDRDDFIQFSADKKATFDEGTTRCNSSDPQSSTGTWDFNGDQTKLTLSDPDQSSSATLFDLVTLDAKTLTLSTTTTATQQGVTYTAKLTDTFTSF